jgi:hypothetical protein
MIMSISETEQKHVKSEQMSLLSQPHRFLDGMNSRTLMSSESDSTTYILVSGKEA